MTIVLGAGASAPSGLPDWNMLIARVLVKSGAVDDERAAELLLVNQDPALVAEAARQAARDSWEAILAECLYEGCPDPLPSPLHLAAAGHYLSGRGVPTELATLNFDTLLEEALAAEGQSIEAVTDSGRSGTRGAVYHLHGVIAKTGDDYRVRDVVISFRDFEGLIANEHPWQEQFLESSTSDGGLLLVATSYRDPDIRHWLYKIQRRRRYAHRPRVFLVRESFRFTREEFNQVRGALQSEWDAVQFSPVIVNDYADAAAAIRELDSVCEPDYVPPDARAHEFWVRLGPVLQAWETTFSDELRDDSLRLAQHFGCPVSNATLWVVDDRSRLARVASQDRFYRGVDAMRRVPLGFDSPWVAGRALSAERALLEDRDVNREPTRPWASVLAVPIMVGDGRFAPLALAVVTFGLASRRDELLASSPDWEDDARTLVARQWTQRLSPHAVQV